MVVPSMSFRAVVRHGDPSLWPVARSGVAGLSFFRTGPQGMYPAPWIGTIPARHEEPKIERKAAAG
jgi:hypothetical protein